MLHKTTLVHLTKHNGRRLVLNPHHIAGLFDYTTGCYVALVGREGSETIQLAESYETALAMWAAALSE